MYALVNYSLTNTTKINSLKYLTDIVCFNHWSNFKFTPYQISKIADT